ncbi:MAG: ABC transporter substrate-binding protein [Burkholderiales bacterium]|nr:MAG: ABC transporter substrate-binding protein [Burkholderiales bacterium]
MWSRRAWLAAGSAFAGSMVAAGAFGQAPDGEGRTRSRVVIAVEDPRAFCYLPLTVAMRLGYFAAQGLDVQWRETADPDQASQLLLSGAAQAMSVPYSAAIALHARGHRVQSIVLQGRAPQLVLGVSTRTLGHFRDWRDLRGRRVAIPAPGSGPHRMTRLLLARSGIQSAQEVQFVALPDHADAARAFRSGTVDALCHTDPLMTKLEQEGGLRVVADTRTPRGSDEVFGGPMPAGCLCVSEEFARTQPGICQALVDAMVLALKWLQTAGPSDIIKVVPEPYFRGDRALYLAAFARAREAWTPDGLMPQRGPLVAARVMAQFDDSGLLQRVPLERTYTNELALRAKQRFRA